MFVPSCVQGAFTSVSHGRSKSNKVSADSRQIIKQRLAGLKSPLTKRYPGLLYNGRVKLQANVLCQLRSGVNRLNKYLSKISAVETAVQCNQGEDSVDQFLFRCPRWTNFRGEIRRLAKQPWGDTSYLLGGGQESKKMEC